MEGMWLILKKGGIFIYPILLCSIVSVAIFIDRILALRERRIVPDGFIMHIEELLKKGKVREAIFICQGHNSSIAKIFLIGLKNMGKDFWAIRELIQDRGEREAVVLERNLSMLSTISHLSPLLGLLGTVSGMIKTFNILSGGPVTDPSRLAGGISEALISTAVGLSVAIPSLLGYRILKGKAKSLIFKMEEKTLRFLELLEQKKGLIGDLCDLEGKRKKQSSP